MKMIVAIIRPEKLEAVQQALAESDVYLMTVSDVRGCGRQRGFTEVYRGAGARGAAAAEAQAGDRRQRRLRRGDRSRRSSTPPAPARPARSATARSSCCRWTTASRSAPARPAAWPSDRRARGAGVSPAEEGVLRVWLTERRGEPSDPLFPSCRRGPLSRDAVALLVAKHASAAAQRCPSLTGKTVTPHVLRHTCAMSLLAVGVDISVIALWLGHEGIETTQIYLHADLALKERALARTAPAATKPGRYRAPTRSSPSSKRFDYADSISAKPLPRRGSEPLLGIIRCSA